MLQKEKNMHRAWKLFEFEDQGEFNIICLLENI